MSEKSSIFILPALLSPIFMSIKTIGRVVEGWVAAIAGGGSAHLAADHNTWWQALSNSGQIFECHCIAIHAILHILASIPVDLFEFQPPSFINPTPWRFRSLNFDHLRHG
jgi:hypothetical protein